MCVHTKSNFHDAITDRKSTIASDLILLRPVPFMQLN